jgi:hypothetical protein
VRTSFDEIIGLMTSEERAQVVLALEPGMKTRFRVGKARAGMEDQEQAWQEHAKPKQRNISWHLSKNKATCRQHAGNDASTSSCRVDHPSTRG